MSEGHCRLTVRRHKAFTLVEVVVAIAIVGLLIALLLPAVQHVRETASRARCQNRLHQIGLAAHQYHDANLRFPTGMTGSRDPQFPYMAWPARLLPFVEQSSLWEQARREYAERRWPFVPQPHAGLSTAASAFQCPSDPRVESAQDTHNNYRVALTSFVGNLGLDYQSMNGVLFLDSKVSAGEISDGTSNTLLAGERPPSVDFWYGWWYAGFGQNGTGSVDSVLGVRERNFGGGPVGFCPTGPYHFQAGTFGAYCDVMHFWSPHPGGANFAFCDGSVRFLAYSADPIMPALATRAGGEAVTAAE